MTANVHSTKEIAEIVAPIAKEYGVGKLSIFGSYARGDATKDSDIDFLIIEKGKLRSLFLT